MQKHLDHVALCIFDKYYFPGENIRKLLTRALRLYDESNHKAIVIMGGICGITTDDGVTKKNSIHSYDSERVARKFRRSVRKGLTDIKHDHPNVQVVIAPVIGIKLTASNRSPAGIVGYDSDGSKQRGGDMNNKNIKIHWITKMVHHCRGKGKGPIGTNI